MSKARPFEILAMAAGASGYFYKSCGFEHLAIALEVVLTGSVYLPEPVKKLLTAPRVATVEGTKLSPREAEVLARVLKGWNNSQIGDNLHLSASSVKAHLRSLFQKLSVDDRVSLAVQAVRMGLDSQLKGQSE